MSRAPCAAQVERQHEPCVPPSRDMMQTRGCRNPHPLRRCHPPPYPSSLPLSRHLPAIALHFVFFFARAGKTTKVSKGEVRKAEVSVQAMGLLRWIGLGGKGDATQSDSMSRAAAGGDSFPGSNSQQDLLKMRVHKQLASQYLNELAQKISEKCFERCYKADTSTIDTAEGACSALCADRYLDTFNEVRRTLVSRNRR